MDILWAITCENLLLTQILYNLQVHAFVLMPNHFHMLCSTPHANLSESMQFFLSQLARELNKRTGRINQIHGSRYYRCLIRNPLYYTHAYKYVYRNPVKANLSGSVENYKYSTLQMYCGLQPIQIKLSEDDLLNNDFDETLRWLNTKPNDQTWSEIRCALRKTEFKLSAQKTSRLPSQLQTERF